MLVSVSLDLARRHLADLRRTTSPETPSSGLSHLIWSVKAILSVGARSLAAVAVRAAWVDLLGVD